MPHIFYEQDPEVVEEEQYALDESDRPTFEAQLDRINETGISYFNGLYLRGLDGLRAHWSRRRTRRNCTAPLHGRSFISAPTERSERAVPLRKSMGDLRHQSFEEVWNGEEYHEAPSCVHYAVGDTRDLLPLHGPVTDLGVGDSRTNIVSQRLRQLVPSSTRHSRSESRRAHASSDGSSA